MEELRKTSYRGKGNSDKYYIDCSHYAENQDSIETELLLKNTKNPDVTILKAVAKDETIKKKNRHIVVKISREKDNNTNEYMAQKEYRIAQVLNGISGFIKYICIFGCYDNINEKIKPIKTEENPIPITTKICDATEKIEKNWKYVLIMPYIQEGSIDGFIWRNENIELLKLLIIHTVLSLTVAFEKFGFVHKDLHLGNVLFKKTKIKEIEYTIENDETQITVQTMGYKVVIMDFEKGNLNEKNTFFFWDDLITFLKNIDGKKTPNKNNEMIEWDDIEILGFLKNRRKEKQPIKSNVNKLINLIENSNMEIITLKPQLKYDPNKL